MEWVVSLPQAELISLAQFHPTNPLPVSQRTRRPVVLGREWVVRERSGSALCEDLAPRLQEEASRYDWEGSKG